MLCAVTFLFRGRFFRLYCCFEWQARGHSPEDYYSMVDSLHTYEAEQDEQQKGHKADVWIQLEQQSLFGDDSQRKCDLLSEKCDFRSKSMRKSARSPIPISGDLMIGLDLP